MVQRLKDECMYSNDTHAQVKIFDLETGKMLVSSEEIDHSAAYARHLKDQGQFVSECQTTILYHFDQFGRHAPRIGVVWTKLVSGHRSQPIWPVSKCGS